MPLKTWILDKVNRVNALFVREDLPPREPSLARVREGMPAPPADAASADAPFVDAEHLGLHAPLIEAVRDELERFVAAHVRHHLAIAEHDRFLLTSIEVATEDAGEPLRLLRRFTREFRPEQIKRFLVREVIAGLPNAAAIDLSQFSGLAVRAAGEEPPQEQGDYAELLKALGESGPGAESSAYRVELSGRWVEGLAPPAATAAFAATPGAVQGSPATPLAGAGVEIDIGDAGGERRVTLAAVQPGRRYVVGKDPRCDIVVQGTYTSRRHCEIWLDRGAWWVLDAGSTNGIRVESAAGLKQVGMPSDQAGVLRPIELRPGERIVLSALARGGPGEHPWLALCLPAATPATPLAGGSPVPTTPVTPIVATQRPAPAWSLSVRMASGPQSIGLAATELPLSVGRSRSCALVIDRAHESVSGHHLDIVALDEGGAEVVVRGANGVTVDARPHASGARFRWRAGEPMALGRPSAQEPACLLQLSHRAAPPAAAR